MIQQNGFPVDETAGSRFLFPISPNSATGLTNQDGTANNEKATQKCRANYRKPIIIGVTICEKGLQFASVFDMMNPLSDK